MTDSYKLDPNILKPGLITDKETLKKNMTTSSYTSGKPGSADLTYDVIGYDGNLKEAYVDEWGNLRKGLTINQEYQPLSTLRGDVASDGYTLKDVRSPNPRPLQPGRCLTLNGSTQYAHAVPVAGFLLEDFTTSCWYRGTTPSGGGEFLMCAGGAGGGNDWDMYVDGATGFARARTSAAANNLIGTSIVNDGEWHLITATRIRGGVHILYVDGMEEVRLTDAYPANSLTATGVRMGRRSSGSYLGGDLKECTIWRRALTAKEVAAIYVQGKTPDRLIPEYPRDFDEQWLFECNDNTREECVNPNGDHAIIYNAPTITTGSDQPACHQNLYGYTDDGDGTFTPASNLNPQLDRDGGTLTYAGLAVGNARLVSAPSAHFDGTDDYVALPNIWSAPTEGAISCRLKADTTGAEQRVIAYNDDGVYALIRINNTVASRISASVSDGVSNYEVTTDAYDVTEWHDVTLRWEDNGVVELIVDGVSAGTAAIGTSGEVLGVGRTIGIGRTALTQPFDGQIHDVKFYSDNAMNNLAAHYPLAEGEGTVAYDTVGGNHGTITNVTLATFWSTQDDYHYNEAYGASLYEHASLDPIWVPYSSTGSPLTITPPSGYTLTVDRPAQDGLTTNSLINFNYQTDAPQSDLSAGHAAFSGADSRLNSAVKHNAVASYELKFEFKTGTAATMYPIDARDAGADGLVIVMVNGVVALHHNAGSPLITSAGTWNDGEWHKLVARWDGTTATLQIDNTFASAAIATPLVTTAGITIGARTSVIVGYSAGFAGSLRNISWTQDSEETYFWPLNGHLADANLNGDTLTLTGGVTFPTITVPTAYAKGDGPSNNLTAVQQDSDRDYHFIIDQIL